MARLKVWNATTAAWEYVAYASDASLATQIALQAAREECRRLADLGQFTVSGLTLTANATPTKLDMAAGVAFMATTELIVAAQAAISTTIASLADATNPKWVVVELDSSSVVQFNQGTAAASPAFPTITTTRTPLGFLFVPANATNVDTLLTTNNGLAKLIDARCVRSVHPARALGRDTSYTSLTNPTALTTLLSGTIPCPANSLSVGDLIHIRGGVRYQNTQNASTLRLQLLMAAAVLFDVTFASLAADANPRFVEIDILVEIISSTTAAVTGHANVTGASATAPATNAALWTATSSVAIDTTISQPFDLKTLIGTSSSTAIVTIRPFAVEKTPA